MMSTRLLAALGVPCLSLSLLGAVRQPQVKKAGPAPLKSSIRANAAVSRLPYAQAGLTARQAAVHLLDRFAFGARPGEIDRLVAMGLDRWLEAQLAGNLPDKAAEDRLSAFPLRNQTLEETLKTYPQQNEVLRAAYQEGVLTQEEFQKKDRASLRPKLLEFARQKGYRPPQELAAELRAQKLIRAVYSENQLSEVLSDFWFNHFNVSLTENKAQIFIPSYERDAIRPHVLGRFRDLLGATAKHPAMLLYLDNARSQAPAGATTLLQLRSVRNSDAVPRRALLRRIDATPEENGVMEAPAMKSEANPAPRRMNRPQRVQPNRPLRPKRQQTGINENYARELMELHTLGVDGGYTQKDVIEVARALTGWTVFPTGPRAEQLRRQWERRGEEFGLVRSGGFLFRPGMHDAGTKTILGTAFPAGGGMEEGERVLDMLARHPSTAKRLAHRIAVRFVSDTPPPALEARLAKVFLNTDGDLKAVVRVLAQSPEFWSPAARRAKIKSPFELAASALRGLNADVVRPQPLVQWVARMGQPLYAYQPPTGYPDRARQWVNTGALLNRMNFGLQLACERIPGVRFDLGALNNGHEPESATAALKTYAALLMPERDLSETMKQLTPVINDPALAEKVDAAAPKPAAESPEAALADEAMSANPAPASDRMPRRRAEGMNRLNRRMNTRPPTMIEQVVGVLLGSPEFQRR